MEKLNVTPYFTVTGVLLMLDLEMEKESAVLCRPTN